MNNDIPPALDRRRVAIELTGHLGSLGTFSRSQQEDSELQRYGRKIIALTEVARITLTREGVKLYLFVLCSSTLLPFKSAYFKLLVLIRRRKHAFPSELDGRLLLPLCTRLVICCGDVDPRAQLGIDDLLEVPETPTGKRTTHRATPKSDESDVMPPPDAFASKKARIDQLGDFIKQQSAKKSCAGKRLVPKQYPAGDGAQGRLVPKQYPAGDGAQGRLVPKQYPAGDGAQWCLMPKQYPAGDGAQGRLVPTQYPAGDGAQGRLVPKQYPAGDGARGRLMPKQYPAG
ncbi:uncharacterized protein EDB91DRAFT_1078399 [Suillus paluster]|uniref:uncharacterized protein n=1 Tax=Suillus paluster TaxID=48578 RepID=UPI001B86CD6D|nr:uncharacterized protein EDB91DRAFT_1078399 [Suillus paluster]KAG1750333.1 hypothetical protein EDB91DRAFT_1078399 [Suillus paluster]